MGQIVAKAVQATVDIRRQELAKQDAAFAKAVADGMPYSDQIELRKQQIESAKSSPFADGAYIDSLEGSLADTKKLARYDTYRTKYADTLSELRQGKDGVQSQIDTLQSQVNTITDPALALEMKGHIAELYQLSSLHDKIIADNEKKKIDFDGTVPVITAGIAKLQQEKTSALMRGDAETAGYIDQYMSNANKHLQQAKVDDVMTAFSVKVATTKTDAVTKLDMLRAQAASADSVSPITVNGSNYASAKEYWNSVMGSYLNGTGGRNAYGAQTGDFKNFFSELHNDISMNVSALEARDKYATNATLDSIKSTFDTLSARPELAPYLTLINQYKEATLASAAVSNIETTIKRGDQSPAALQLASANLKNIQATYGVNTEDAQLALSQKALEYATNKAKGLYGKPSGGQIINTAKDLGIFNVAGGNNPINAPIPGSEPTPTSATDSAGSVAAMAKQYGIDNYTGTSDQVSQLMSAIHASYANPSPNGQTPSTPSATPTTPSATDTTTPKPPTTTTPNPPTDPSIAAPQTTTPAAPTTPAPAAVAPTPAPVAPAAYGGGSITDYLASKGQASDFASRSKLAATSGITNYTGSADQNTALLTKLRGT